MISEDTDSTSPAARRLDWLDLALHSPLSHSYQLFILALCLFALGVLAAHTLVQLDARTKQILDIADNAICAVFFVDFLVHVARAKHKWQYLATWGWVDLLSSVPAIPVFRIGRAARVIRILRVARGARATKLISEAILERRGRGLLLSTLLVALLLLVFASIGILQLETTPEANIKSAGDAIWWAVVTITTVGYGDRYPVTAEGRFLAAVLMVFGVALFGVFSGFVASWFVGDRNDEQETQSARLAEEIAALRADLAGLRRSTERLNTIDANAPSRTSQVD